MVIFLGVLAGALPAAAARFDGKWLLKFRAGDNCLVQKSTSVVIIAGNRITGNDRQRFGTVSRAGKFRIQGINSIGSHDVVMWGTLKRRSGRGFLSVAGGICSGTVTLTRQ
ncbi:MAG: hypothetical protein OEM91_00425 [Hyphomicrobiales bacterium]|nr:hypothetical protein [Hyphomicrobiales bacterium]